MGLASSVVRSQPDLTGIVIFMEVVFLQVTGSKMFMEVTFCT